MNLIHDKKDNQWERKFYSKNIRKIDNQKKIPGFPGGAVVEYLPANAGDMGLSLGLGGSHMPRSN